MKNKKGLIILILLVIICFIVYFVCFKNTQTDTANVTYEEISVDEEESEVDDNSSSLFYNFKDEVITAENYEEISNKIADELGDSDDTYYLSYSLFYYIMTDGMANLDSDDENAMYVNIYGKTVGQLIEEGKQLMEENDVTLEEYKAGLEELNEENQENQE